jgi:YD repeat-containing protein
VPTDLTTTKGRIRVQATDTSGVVGYDDSDADFVVAQGIERTHVYDEIGRLVQIIYEDGKKINYAYDAAGNRITVTNE